MNAIAPIQTYFDGYKFRSRTEARWAVWLNALGIRYEYEPQGYTWSNVCYLPDFYLPDLNLWMEVKGVSPNSDDLEKIIYVASGTRKSGLIVVGSPWFDTPFTVVSGLGVEEFALFPFADFPDLNYAYYAARQARFEFGETPKPIETIRKLSA